MKKQTFKVKGMTCASCETIIERKLRKVEGITHVSAKSHKAEVCIESENGVSREVLGAALEGTPYLVSDEEKCDHQDNKSENKKGLFNALPLNELGWRWAIIIGSALLILAWIFLPSSFFNVSSYLGMSDSISYGLVFVIGLIAATSTCLAISGGLLLTFASGYNEKYPDAKGWAKFKPHIFFNVGRIVSYTVLGGLVGLLGSIFTFSIKATAIITLIASVMMIVMGLHLLKIPFFSRFKVTMPKFISHKIHDSSEKGKNSMRFVSLQAFALGAATFFLPCGFTQSLQLYILTKGSFIVGALTMLVFSLGTLPALLGVGMISTFSSGKLKKGMMVFAAVLVIILGFLSMRAALLLLGAM